MHKTTTNFTAKHYYSLQCCTRIQCLDRALSPIIYYWIKICFCLWFRRRGIRFSIGKSRRSIDFLEKYIAFVLIFFLLLYIPNSAPKQLDGFLWNVLSTFGRLKAIFHTPKWQNTFARSAKYQVFKNSRATVCNKNPAKRLDRSMKIFVYTSIW